MFLLISLTTYLILENKYSRKVAVNGALFCLSLLLISKLIMKSTAYNYTQLLLLSMMTILTAFSTYTLEIKRKYISFPLFLLPISLVVLHTFIFNPESLLSKVYLGTIIGGGVIGTLLSMVIYLPLGFQSLKEFNLFNIYLKSSKKDITALIAAQQLNITNFFITIELMNFLIKAKDNSYDNNIKKLLLNSLFYWTQQPTFNSLNPLVTKFNSLNFEQLKKFFVVYDLSDNDVELLFKIFRCGCWKPGLFILDQYLISNKFSTKYPSTLIFADKFLLDLKKISFDDESIEYWLKNYSTQFKGSPISQKINLIYHNTDDWFNRDIRYAAI